MLEILQNIFTSNQFIPHGHCYLWKPGLVGLNILLDSLIALAYYSIPLLLVKIVRKRGDLPFDWIFILFGTFIVACGTGHLLDIWTLWHPIYWISGLMKALTALVSVATGIVLMSLVPKILALPSPAQLEEANRKLETEIEKRYLVEEKLQLAMNNIPQFMFWKDRNSVYQGCNRNFALAAGLDNPEDIVGLTDYELAWKREESDFFRQCDARVMTTDTPEYHIIETQLQADGTQTWVDTNKVPLHNDEGNVIGILGTYEDITARKLAEEELQATVAELRALFAAMSDVIIVMDAKGSYLKIAPTNPSLSYKPPAELLGKTLHEVFPKAEADAFLCNIRRALEQRQTVNTEYSMIIGNNEYWFANSISPIQEDSVIIVARDITERKILEKELAMREQLLNSFITAAPVGLCILDD
ncbi:MULTISPECIES: PAS domain-containing protein [Cyanophyceae]|uniref:PAS domain-containing protein n=1 Tax=Cyanophyceae TaxID=3028117 RepID=UPI001685A114|nr:PAS domain-containing protein [Trichocoleus sp. FACHB-40]MBD2005321.1 PAS domain-containing protein [Trichocoleus sp. FACHB-40]